MRRRAGTFATALFLATASLVILPVRAQAIGIGVCGGSAATTWTGAVSFAWTNASNWTAGVPTSGVDVCIPFGTVRHAQITGATSVTLDKLEVLGGLEILGTSTLTLNGASSVTGVNIAANLVVNSTLDITDHADVGAANISGSGSIVNTGRTQFYTASLKTVNITYTSSGNVLWDDGNVDFGSHTFTNNGSWTIGASSVSISAANVINNGTITKSTSGSVVWATNVDNNGEILFENASTFRIDTGKTFLQDREMHIHDSTIDGAGMVQQSDPDAKLTMSGMASLIPSTTVQMSNGELEGTGTIHNLDMSGGTLSVGRDGDIGSLSMDSFNQTGGTLAMDLKGETTPGTDYDQVTAATLHIASPAILQISAPNYAPQDVDYHLVNATSFTGTFDVKPNPPGAFSFDVQYTGGAMTTSRIPVVPGRPSIGATTGGDKTVSVTVVPPLDNGGVAISGYVVSASPGGATVSMSNTSVPAVFSGLTNGTAYTFTATATNAVGAGSSSAVSSSVTPAVAPDAPSIDKLTPGDGAITVSFLPPAFNGGSTVTSYQVTTSPGGATASGATSPLTVSGLTNGTAYTFTVTATNTAGTSVASAASAAIAPAAVASAPTITSVKAGVNSVIVAFDAPVSNGGALVTEYVVTSLPNGKTAKGAMSPITVPGLAADGSYTFVVAAVNSAGMGANSAVSDAVTPMAPTTSPGTSAGYFVPLNGDKPTTIAPFPRTKSSVTGVVPTASGGGAWTATSDGGVFTAGDAAFFGSMGGSRLNAPTVGIASTPTGGGYYLVATDGGVFTFGDAVFAGSMGGQRLYRPIVGMAAGCGGEGYYLVASDGGVFAYGGAPFYGSMGGKPLNQPIVAITPVCGGYYLLAADGGVFTFGSAEFHGSAVGDRSLKTPQALIMTTSGNGYWIADAKGMLRKYGS